MTINLEEGLHMNTDDSRFGPRDSSDPLYDNDGEMSAGPEIAALGRT